MAVLCFAGISGWAFFNSWKFFFCVALLYPRLRGMLMTPGTRDLVRGALIVNAHATGARLDELVKSIEAAEARFRAQHPGVAYDDDVKITSSRTAVLILKALPPDVGRWEMAF
jgi:hypothetical protein